MKPLVATITLIAGSTVAALAQPTFDFIDLGVPAGYNNCLVQDVDEDNRALVIVQTPTPAPWGSKSYIWQDGTFTEVGPYQSYARTEAKQFGPDGSVVGYSYLKVLEWPTTVVGWIWKGGTFSVLPSLGANATSASSINASSQCTGWSYPPNVYVSMAHAFIATKSATKHVGDIRLLSSNGMAINNAGILCATAPSFIDHTWAGGAVSVPAGGLHEIGTLGGLGTYMTSVSAINSKGQVVGNSYTGDGPTDNPIMHAMLWHEGVTKDLGTLPGDPTSSARGINDAGVIVGFSGPYATARACMWKDGQVVDLNAAATIPAGWQVKNAATLNEKGVIVGSGLVAGKTRAWMMIPKP